MNDVVRNDRSRDTILSAPGEELGGVDQAPVDVFKCLATVADAGEIAAADFDFVRRGLAGQNAKVECAQGRALVGCACSGFRPEPCRAWPGSDY